MTLEEIRTAILADDELKQLAILGSDGTISAMMSTPNTSPALLLSELMSKLTDDSIAKLVDNGARTGIVLDAT